MRAAVLALTWRAASRSAPRSSITRTTSLWPICDAIHSGAVPSCGERTQHPRDGGLRPREGSQRPTTRVILTHVSRLALGSARTTWVSASIQILAYKSHCTAGPFHGTPGNTRGKRLCCRHTKQNQIRQTRGEASLSLFCPDSACLLYGWVHTTHPPSWGPLIPTGEGAISSEAGLRVRKLKTLLPLCSCVQNPSKPCHSQGP